jgi:hypothetical protein
VGVVSTTFFPAGVCDAGFWLGVLRRALCSWRDRRQAGTTSAALSGAAFRTAAFSAAFGLTTGRTTRTSRHKGFDPRLRRDLGRA